MSKAFAMPVARVYPLYLTKIEKKGRSQAELDAVILWLTGFNKAELDAHLEAQSSFEEFFAAAELNENASLITGLICGIRVEDIEDELMQRIRYLDKLVDELARGKALEKVLRS